jgi:hypothetical protein
VSLYSGNGSFAALYVHILFSFVGKLIFLTPSSTTWMKEGKEKKTLRLIALFLSEEVQR